MYSRDHVEFEVAIEVVVRRWWQRERARLVEGDDDVEARQARRAVGFGTPRRTSNFSPHPPRSHRLPQLAEAFLLCNAAFL